MRIAVGDLHGRRYYEDYLNDEDEFFFLGDYFDNPKIGPRDQIETFNNLVALARKNPKIHLLLGNHDYHYILNDKYERYSGFQTYQRFDIKEALDAAEDLLTPVIVTNDRIILSHAGVSKVYMDSLGIEDPNEINAIYKREPLVLAFRGYEPYGNSPENSPIWIRPESLLPNMPEGYKQIVGHTQTQFDEIKELEGGKLVLCDTGGKDVYRF